MAGNQALVVLLKANTRKSRTVVALAVVVALVLLANFGLTAGVAYLAKAATSSTDNEAAGRAALARVFGEAALSTVPGLAQSALASAGDILSADAERLLA